MNTNKITSFETGRLLALMCVIIIHATPFMTEPMIHGQPWPGIILNQLGRFAVPLFFVIAGYFIQPRLSTSPMATFSRYSLTLFKVLLAWSIIYLRAPFNLTTVFENGYMVERAGYWNHLLLTQLNTLFEGGSVHLWFLPSLILGVGIIALLCHYEKKQFILPLALALFGYGLMTGSYQTFFEVELPINSRNGPFFSTLLIAIGFELRQRQWQASNTVAVIMLLAGWGLHFFEAGLLTMVDVPFNEHDYLIGTPVWVTGIFLLLKNYPQLGQANWVQNWSNKVLGIYLCHMLVIIYLMNLFGMLGIDIGGLVYDFSIVPATFLLSILLIKLIELTPLRSLLLR